MDLLSDPPVFDIHDAQWPLHSTLTGLVPNEVAVERQKKSIVGDRCFIRGEIEGSVIFPGAYIGDRAKVKNSVIMPGARVDRGARVEQAIVGPGAVVESGCIVVGGGKQPIAVVAQNAVVSSSSMEVGA